MIAKVHELLHGSMTSSEFLDCLKPFFPAVQQLAETPQDPSWHAEGNVRIHTEMVIDALLEILRAQDECLSEREIVSLLLGAALHDIGKVHTTKVKPIDGINRIVSPRHAEVGMSYCALRLVAVPQICKTIFDWTLGIIGYHHHPRQLVNSGGGLGAYSRIARSIPLRLLAIFERADLHGRVCEDLETQLEVLQFFELEARENGVWDTAPYGGWMERIIEEFDIREKQQADFVFQSAVYWFEHGTINSLEEAIGKSYKSRANHAHLILLCGPSGSGKSKWVEELRNCRNASVISLDALREEIGGKRSRQADNGKVMQAAKSLLRESLRANETIIWDATTLRQDGRASLVSIAHDYHASTEIVRFAVPPSELARRNRKRSHCVAEKVLERQIERFQWPHLWEAHQVTTYKPA